MSLRIALSENEGLVRNSEPIPITPNQKYRVSGNTSFKGGMKYSAFVAAIALAKNGREVKRFIRWIPDFRGNSTAFSITFNAPVGAESLIIGYRVNRETPVRSETELEITPPSAAMLQKVDANESESYDSDRDFEIPLLPVLTHEQENELERRTIWLFGSPRSGTTWLMEMLRQPCITWSEPFIGSMLGADWKNRMVDNFYKIKPEFFFSAQHLANWKPMLRSLIMQRAFSHAQTVKKPLLIKEALGSSGADIISRVLPDSKILCIIRDGRDTVDSNLDAHRKGGWGHDVRPIPLIDTPEKRINWIREYSEQWKKINDVILKAYNQHNPSLHLMVKYEELRGNTLEEMRKIHKFLDLHVSDEALQERVEKFKFENIPTALKGDGKFHRAASPGLWKEHFSPEEQQLMNSIMGDTLKAFGYTV